MKEKITRLVLVFVAGLFVMASGIVVRYGRVISKPAPEYELSSVNAFDRVAAHSYSAKLDFAGGIGVAVCNGFSFAVLILMPLAGNVVLRKSFCEYKELLLRIVIFGECWLFVQGLLWILKNTVGRVRPYMYFEGAPEKYIASGDFCRSWPSGHSASAWLAFGFLMGVMAGGWECSAGKKRAVCAVLAALCAATCILRVLSGNHFATDTICGAILGCSVSFAVAGINYSFHTLSFIPQKSIFK